MKYLKRFDESKVFSITKEVYDDIVQDVNYIVQDILDRGCSLNISSYGYKDGLLSLDFCITIDIKSTKTNWFSMDSELYSSISPHAFNIKDILLQLNSYLSEYGCKLKVSCHNYYIDVDKIEDSYVWRNVLLMKIVQKDEKGWISKIFKMR